MSRRWRYHSWAFAFVPLAPVFLPILGVAVWLDDIGRARELPRPRYATWFWRIWWWYGYHGVYQLAWDMRRVA